MKPSFIIFLFFVSCSSGSPDQSGNAHKLITMFESGDIRSPEKYLSSNLLSERNKTRLDSVINAFSRDYNILKEKAERGLTKVNPGVPVYRFRYFTNKGTELQLDICYDDKVTSLAVRIEFISIERFKQERTTNRVAGSIKIE